ncbi:NAD(P)-dependent dehydrogenase, short-chain alcohol dehydrogenase family [Chitinophaga terrae (ex Kim and Jung 2007)]|uniref:NAD(P)-dependent dehydrogenase, short-chain alcohol dehydrogenase family n=1 Tax=Chitinophaga terrae (ex Kim and Jung 2007) TaxID=408074 RepID=A0A1H4CQM1_9BACT|nr:SDR family oxidoreductase [Chitinophaga terrae (ex Kim and Jung 2007)]GEP90394.1 oxidoreductase [Chitinophaga terrae (ex Kim and Jung 2007)]SEA62670.1 NAD(P)-dependent dehydrogenase, short-chain alcohol dehydrogenase family [Chitinophaga terrae (ex Kim and Jung 2007)]
MKELKDKIAIVTGGNSGIGYATAKELVAQGATVIITGRRREAIEKAAAEIGALPFVADQAKIEDTALLFDEVKKQYGKVDILFVNAGITGVQLPIEQMTTENFDSVMGINFRGAYFTLSKFIPLLSDGASVVILSSIVASTYHANSSVYQASKAALNSIAKTAAAELAARNIRVNIVSPGPTKTEILSKSGLDEDSLQQLTRQLVLQIPLKRMGAAEDIAKWVVYLSGDSARFITGAEITMDGGLTL